MAHIIRQTVQDTLGKEAALGVIGRLYLVLGLVSAVGGAVLSAWLGSFAWLGAGLVFLAFGTALHVLFGALAEVIALLKRLCGLKSAIGISGTSSGEISLCSECGAMVYSTSEKCPRCKERFDGPAAGASKDAVSGEVHSNEKGEVR
jgi:hypothetical protein